MSTIVLASNSAHPSVDRWDDLFNRICPQYGIEPNLAKAHCEFESDGDPNAVGGSGRGVGLMQLDYGTYKSAGGVWFYGSVHGTTDQVFDPATNILIACRDFLQPLKSAFGSNLAARIAGYNAGIGAVQEALDAGTDLTTITFDPNYIRNIERAFMWFDQLSQRGAA